MARKMSRQREAVLDLVRREGPLTPARLAFVHDLQPATARKLLFSMLSDDQLASPERGLYTLPHEQTVTSEGDVAKDVTESAHVTADVTETEESREDIPILGESPSGIYVYSHSLNAMIPNQEHRRNKGYR